MFGTEELNSAGWRSLVRRRAPATIAGVVGLGIVCSILYDLLVKPGLSAGARAVLTLATLGSATLRDSAYGAAALDPTPVTPLLLLAGGMGVMFAPAVLVFVGPRTQSSARQISDGPSDKASLASLRSQVKTLRGSIRRSKIVLAVLLALYIPAVLVAFAIHNQSIAIWRVFHADIAIVRPFVSERQAQVWLSRFAQIKTRGEFIVLQAELADVAAANQVELKDVSLW